MTKDELIDRIGEVKPGLIERTIAEAGFVLVPTNEIDRKIVSEFEMYIHSEGQE